jgi:hypothetical protein
MTVVGRVSARPLSTPLKTFAGGVNVPKSGRSISAELWSLDLTVEFAVNSHRLGLAKTKTMAAD